MRTSSDEPIADASSAMVVSIVWWVKAAVLQAPMAGAHLRKRSLAFSLGASLAVEIGRSRVRAGETLAGGSSAVSDGSGVLRVAMWLGSQVSCRSPSERRLQTQRRPPRLAWCSICPMSSSHFVARFASL